MSLVSEIPFPKMLIPEEPTASLSSALSLSLYLSQHFLPPQAVDEKVSTYSKMSRRHLASTYLLSSLSYLILTLLDVKKSTGDKNSLRGIFLDTDFLLPRLKLFQSWREKSKQSLSFGSLYSYDIFFLSQ